MAWFRFDAGALNNPKVQRLSAEEFRTWVNLLCLASSSRGQLPTMQDISFALRIPDQKARATIESLRSKKLIDGNGDQLQMHDWNTWQYVSDNSTERVRKHRETVSRNGHETFPKRQPEVTETPSDQIQNRSHTQQSASVSAPIKMHAFAAVGDDFPETCFQCGEFRDSISHFRPDFALKLEPTPDEPAYWIERFEARHPNRKNISMFPSVFIEWWGKHPLPLTVITGLNGIDDLHEKHCDSGAWKDHLAPPLPDWWRDKRWLEPVKERGLTTPKRKSADEEWMENG